MLRFLLPFVILFSLFSLTQAQSQGNLPTSSPTKVAKPANKSVAKTNANSPVSASTSLQGMAAQIAELQNKVIALESKKSSLPLTWEYIFRGTTLFIQILIPVVVFFAGRTIASTQYMKSIQDSWNDWDKQVLSNEKNLKAALDILGGRYKNSNVNE